MPQLAPDLLIGILNKMVDLGPLVPASRRKPHEHWEYITNDAFVRGMTDKIAKSKFWQPKTKDGMMLVAKTQTEAQLERADFGGPDGHVPGEISFAKFDFSLLVHDPLD